MVEYHWSRLCGKNYFCVIESKKNYTPENSEKNVDFDSSKSYEYAATDTPTSTESGIEMKTFSFNTMIKFTQQEPLQHFFRI